MQSLITAPLRSSLLVARWTLVLRDKLWSTTTPTLSLASRPRTGGLTGNSTHVLMGNSGRPPFQDDAPPHQPVSGSALTPTTGRQVRRQVRTNCECCLVRTDYTAPWRTVEPCVHAHVPRDLVPRGVLLCGQCSSRICEGCAYDLGCGWVRCCGCESRATRMKPSVVGHVTALTKARSRRLAAEDQGDHSEQVVGTAAGGAIARSTRPRTTTSSQDGSSSSAGHHDGQPGQARREQQALHRKQT